MNKDLAANHEAGHAVMQWFVGWSPGVLEMRVSGDIATSANASCPYPDLTPIDAIRKRLLVLFSGQAATVLRWPDLRNNWKDWQDAENAVQRHLGLDVKWNCSAGMSLEPPEADSLVQEAMLKCNEIVAANQVRVAIDQIGRSFATATLSLDGVAQYSEQEIVSVCEREIGVKFRNDNPWSEWIDGA